MYVIRPYITPFEINISKVMYYLPNIYGALQHESSNPTNKIPSTCENIERLDEILEKQNILIDKLKRYKTVQDNCIKHYVLTIDPNNEEQNIYLIMFVLYQCNQSVSAKIFVNYKSLKEKIYLCKNLLEKLFHNIYTNINISFIIDQSPCLLHKGITQVKNSIIIAKYFWNQYCEKNLLNPDDSFIDDLITLMVAKCETDSQFPTKGDNNDVLEELLNLIEPKSCNNDIDIDKPPYLIGSILSFTDILLWSYIFQLKMLNSLALLNPAIYIWSNWFTSCIKYEPFKEFYNLMNKPI